MKILFLAPANSIHTVKWVNALKKHGNEIWLISLPDHKVNEDLEPGIKVIYLPFGGKIGYYINGLTLRRLTKFIEPDVINAHYASGYGTLMRVSKMPQDKCILSVWGDDVYVFPYKNWINLFIIKKNMEYASYIASTSHCMKKQAKKFVKKNKTIVVTPFGVDTENFVRELPYPSEKFVFGCTKSLEYQYGIDILIQAFAKFVAELNGNEKKLISLKIYGDGLLLKELRLLVAKLNIKKQVKFCGKISNSLIPDALNKMNVLCLTSIIDSESFGVAALEAMACQTPVIASDVDGYKEVILHGKTGLIVPRCDVEATFKAMKKLYDNRKYGSDLGKNGRKWVKSKYEWEHCVDIMLNLYRKVCLDRNKIHYES